MTGSSGEHDPQWTTLSPLLVPPEGARLPDLDQRPPTDLAIVKLGRPLGARLHVRGRESRDGPLLIRGLRRQGAAFMRADQVIEFSDGRKLAVPRIGRLRYEPHPPHFHWHLQPFEAYTLRSVANPNLVVRDRKSGFCLIDRYGNAVLPAPKIAPPRFTSNCATGRPDARSVVEGSSPGYRDRYPAFFHGQDVDVTGLPGRAVRARRTRRIHFAPHASSATPTTPRRCCCGSRGRTGAREADGRGAALLRDDRDVSSVTFWLTLAGMVTVTYGSRLVGLTLRTNLPDFWLRFLHFVPIAVFAALVTPSLQGGRGEGEIRLAAAAVVALAAWRTRNLAIALGAGLAAFYLLRIPF